MKTARGEARSMLTALRLELMAVGSVAGGIDGSGLPARHVGVLSRPGSPAYTVRVGWEIDPDTCERGLDEEQRSVILPPQRARLPPQDQSAPLLSAAGTT